jgi:hypothetical protein
MVIGYQLGMVWYPVWYGIGLLLRLLLGRGEFVVELWGRLTSV